VWVDPKTQVQLVNGCNDDVYVHLQKLIISAESYLDAVPLCNRVDQRIKVERWQIGIFRLYEHNVWNMIPASSATTCMCFFLNITRNMYGGVTKMYCELVCLLSNHSHASHVMLC